MVDDRFFSKLVDLQIFRKSDKSASYLLAEGLFRKWLDERRLTWEQFHDFLVENASRVSDIRLSEDNFSTASKNRPNFSNKPPSRTSLRNFTEGDGATKPRPVKRKIIDPILTAMWARDPGLTSLIALGGRSKEKPDERDLALEPFEGLVWEEFHYTTHAGEAKIAKGILRIASDLKVSLTLLEPAIRPGHVIIYEGHVSFEFKSLVFSLGSQNRNESVTLRYPYDKFQGYVPTCFEGLCCGVSFEGRPMATPSVIRRIEEPASLSGSRSIPNDHELIADEFAIEALQKVSNYFEYGPQRSVIHRDSSETNKLFKDEILRLNDGETVDMITTFSPDFHAFEAIIEGLSKDKRRLHRFRCVFLDPNSSAFKLRFALVDQKVEPEDLTAQVDRLKMYEKNGGTGVGVLFDIRYTRFWPTGIGCKIGASTVFIAPIFATQSALKGPNFEFRDLSAGAAKAFCDDFLRLWELGQPEPMTDPSIRDELERSDARKKS